MQISVGNEIFVRVAGVSGATAVILGTIWEHGLKKNATQREIDIFSTAKFYHFVHTVALLAIPISRRPEIVGSLFTAGISIFCGTIYISALTGNTWITRLTPIGGLSFIAGWLMMAL